MDLSTLPAALDMLVLERLDDGRFVARSSSPSWCAALRHRPPPCPEPFAVEEIFEFMSAFIVDKGTVGEVYLWTKSQGEKLFAGASPRGSQNADWIAAGGVYEFRLYEGKEHKRQLASVRVTGEASK